MSPSAVAQPPTPQEVTRKLSLHSVARPVKSPSLLQASGTESDSDSALSPELTSTPGPWSSAGTTGILSSTITQPPLSAIAEGHPGSGEETEEEDEEESEWPAGLAEEDRVKRRGSADDTVVKSGYLYKKGERRKNWKKRWFVLRPAHLAYYKTSAEYRLLRMLDLNEVHACTHVSLKKHANAFGIVSPSRTFYLHAESPTDAQSWVAMINSVREDLQATSTQHSASTAQATTVSPIPIPMTPGRQYPHSPLHGITSSESEAGDLSISTPHSSNISPTRSNFLGTSPSQRMSMAIDKEKVVLQGYLMKCGSKRRNWRKRWFVLTGEHLAYSGSHMDAKHHRQISLTEIIDALECDLPHKSGSAHLSPPLVPSSTPSAVDDGEHHGIVVDHTFKVVTAKRSLLLCAPSEEEEIRWLSAVRALLARRSKDETPGAEGQVHPSAQGLPGSEVTPQAHGSSASTGSGSGGIRAKVRKLSISRSSGAEDGGARH